MKILLVHNRYQQAGGEDSVFQADKKMLENAGHCVISYERDNAEINNYSLRNKVSLYKNTIWSTSSKNEISQILFNEKPDVAHFHNTFPLISPSAYYACKEAGVGIVQALHNYRLLCPNAFFFREGHVCEDCLGKLLPWPGILHACYRGSRAQSVAVATMLTYHRLIKTWQNNVDVFLTSSQFAREKFIQGGIPENKITIRPYFLENDPGLKEEEGQFALFVGRLSQEKGVMTLLKAWQRLEHICLNLVGDGPLLGEVKQFVAQNNMAHVRVLGRLSRKDTNTLYKQARFLVISSEWYENFPMVIVEAFASGLPVLASDLGSLKEIVESGQTGLHFALADSNDLAVKAQWLWSHPGESIIMGQQARKQFETKYSAETSYEKLMEIYKFAMIRRN